MRPVPAKFQISLRYGAPGDYAAGHHTGTDFACPVGTPVRAPFRGRVECPPQDDAYGLYVCIYGPGGKRSWLLAHLSRRDLSLAGRTVKAGTVVGWSGATGNVTGPHLHAEQRIAPFGYRQCVKPTAWNPA